MILLCFYFAVNKNILYTFAILKYENFIKDGVIEQVGVTIIGKVNRLSFSFINKFHYQLKKQLSHTFYRATLSLMYKTDDYFREFRNIIKQKVITNQ